MSSLFKLSIRGIRAFEPEQEETIQFGFPLTLICGQNGCGKTTIIECLKYATTGDLPPNSKGGAFVNDPALSGRTNVTGQIKLAFRNANGKSMITTRTVQLSKRKARGSSTTTNTFKTLEGQLVVIDKGEKVSVSSKNAELDSQTPIYLGALPAILDYVIFCHQDDSLWPLSEALVLKKRFDDIFEASKFTKVLDNLKTIKKDMSTDIKLIEQSVNHLKIDKDRARKLTDTLDKMVQDLESYEAEIVDINLKIDEKEKEANELFSMNQDFQAILSEYDRCQREMELRNEQIERLKSTITLLDNLSDEELLYRLQNYDEIAKNLQNKLDTLNTLKSHSKEKIKSATEDQNTYIRLDGKLRAAEATNESNVEELKSIMSKSGQDLHPAPENFATFLNSIQKEFKKIQRIHNSLKEEKEEELRVVNAEHQNILDAITRETQNAKFLNNSMNSNNEKLLNLRKTLTDAGDDEIKLKEEKTVLETTLKELLEVKNAKRVRTLESEINSKNSELLALEYELEDLSNKLIRSDKQSDVQTRLKIKTELKEENGKKLNELLSRIKRIYSKTMGSDFNSSTYTKDIDGMSQELQEERASLEEKLIKSTAELESNTTTIKTDRNKIQEYKKDSANIKKDILNLLDEDEIDSYEKILADLETSYRNVTEDVNTSEVTRQFNVTAIKIATEKHSCLLCKRSFDESSLSVFLEHLKKSVKEDKMEEISKQAAVIEKELQEMTSIGPKVRLWKELREKLKNTEESLKASEALQFSVQSEVNKLTSSLKHLKEKQESLKSLHDPLSEMKRLNAETESISVELDELQEILGDSSVESKPVHELQRLQFQKNADIKMARQVLNDLVDEKNREQRKIDLLQSKAKDHELVISNLEKSLANVINLRQNIEETSTSIDDIKELIEESNAQLQLYEDQRSRAAEKLQSSKALIGNTIKESEDKVKSTEIMVNRADSLYQSISAYEEVEKIKLDENNAKMEEVSKIKDSELAQLERTESEIKEVEAEINDLLKKQHNTLVNVDYRALLTEVKRIATQIEELDIESAHQKREEYQSRSKDLRQEIASLRSTHDGKSGELKQISDQIKRLKQELKTEYSNVDSNYHEEWIKLQTNVLISNDIQTYSKALDNAIMKYHSIKMEDINRILRELWSQTYKGSDIETIAIKSDVNVQTKGNRSYNYRVVMYKSGNELDMRGRCSAGQKVLTSILIRLALAECFGVNCGIIALDEPTTNLDQENAESLAEALNQIIEFRKQQLNFQLIIITHDENFLTHINGEKFTDHFYKVQRDEQQCSRIYSLPISMIQDH